MDFGDYFHELFKRYDVNVSEMAKNIGVKSVNTLYRLFDNQYSYEKNKELTEKILCHLSLDEQEKTNLFNLMEMCPMNKNMKEAFDILASLHKDEIAADLSNPVIELIREYPDKEIKIFAGSNFTPEIFSSLDYYFRENPHDNISVNHIVNFNAGNKIIAAELFGIVKMIDYNNYSCFESKNKPMEDTIIIIKDGGQNILAVFDENNIFKTDITEEIAGHILRKFGKYKNKMNQYLGRVIDYCSIIDSFAVVENNTIYGLMGAPCLLDIPFDTIKKLLAESNYFGIPTDTPYIDNVMKSLENRYTLREKSDTEKKYFLDINIMKEFLESGRSSDYIEYFRPLKNEEMLEMLNSCFDVSDGTNMSYRFLKDGYRKNNIDCVYVENNWICISNAQKGYNKDYVQMIITHPKVMKLYKQFFEYFWERGTFSEEESRNILNEMIEEYLK